MNTRIFSNVKILGFISAAAIFSFGIVLLQGSESENTVYEGPLKAVIIDQLYDENANEEFHNKATEYLETAGYQVDIFTTKQITVDLYKKLPQMNYKYVILRSHGVSDLSNDSEVFLFTGEKYQSDMYIQEQLFDYVKKGATLSEINFKPSSQELSDWVLVNGTYTLTAPAIKEETTTEQYFLITPKLVDDLMEGTFPGTIFLLGGCSTLSNPSLADSLIKRGGSSVIGWSDNVGSVTNDWFLLNLLELTLINNFEIEEAIELSEQAFPVNERPYPGILKYYSHSNL